jgi:isoleucyl-tRNA synthetase
MAKGLPGAGKHIKEANKDILEDLKKRNLLFHHTIIEHEYPFCWRCANALIYFPRFSWFIEMSRLKEELLKSNEKVNWIPRHLQRGRFGEWLKDVKDWAISRERYWGTPLPIWECRDCDETFVAGGLDDLDKNALNKNRYWIMRHGQSLHNLGEQWIAIDGKDNRSPSQLTSLGMTQAEKAGRVLAKEKIDFIYCSPFKRTRQTAGIVNKYLKAKLIFDKRLVDIDCGAFNGQTVAKHRHFAPGLEAFTKRADGGENLTDVKKRMMDFWRAINAKHQ